MHLKNISIFLILILTFNYTHSSLATQNTQNVNFNNTNLIEIQNFSLSNTTDGNYTLSDLEILEQKLGPRKKPITFQIIMSLTYIIIFLCGLIGNICVCCVIICNNCMHTTTNYYLFSLAVSDVLSLSIGLPPELYSIIVGAYPWVFGNVFCVVRTFIFEATTVASVLTILAFTFERWLHVCYPMFAQKFSSSFSRALKIIIAIWVLSALLAIPFPIGTGAEYLMENVPDSILCKPLDKYQKLMTTILLLSTILLFIVPMTLISLMYISIGLTLWRPQINKKDKNKSVKERFKMYFSLNKPSEPDSRFYVKDVQTSKTSTIHQSLLLKTNKTNVNISDHSICENLTNESLQQNKVNDRRSRELEYISYRTRQSRRDVVKMLFVLVLFFFLCWAPHHLQRIMTFVYAQHIVSNIKVPDLMMNILEFLYYTSGILVYISSTINPILYNVMSKRYRTAFSNTVSMFFTCSCNSKSLAYKRSSYYYNRTKLINNDPKRNAVNKNNTIYNNNIRNNNFNR